MTEASQKFTVQRGFSQAQRPQAAELYWAAFSGKLAPIMGPDAAGHAFFERSLDPDFAITAQGRDGALLGLAGVKMSEGALTDGGFSDLAAVYGWFGAAWRSIPLAFLERGLAPKTLLMDGILVAQDARGLGIGTALLDAVKDHAAQVGCTSVRLDVIDTNPRARALYTRQGFEVVGTEQLGPLRHIFGFRSSTKMLYRLPAG